jgi:hypothetical protein
MSWMLVWVMMCKVARGARGKLPRGAGEACHVLDTCYVGFCTKTVC